MKIIRAEQHLNEAELELCCTVLRQGGILCYPTETYYGFGIDPWNVKGRERIYQAKGRALDKELPLIAASCAMVEKFCVTSNPLFHILADSFWPGPVTLVLPSLDHSMTLAVRVSAHPLARQISEAFGSPIAATSANRSGDPPVSDPAHLPPSLVQSVDLLIDAGPAPGGSPSTIVAFTDGGIRILREGAVPSAGILRAIATRQKEKKS